MLPLHKERKGVIFTATYIETFEKMKDFIEKGTQYVGIPLKEQVESLEVVASMLRMNDASKLLMLKGFYDSYHIPTGFLPISKSERRHNERIKNF
ncbi:hypothetical protein [Mediterraneibacter gnavus]|uniref:hypothetical protein n=1 Tax=Mediterraneibacter gnavus TaxID=33038 RepID=UPI003565D5F2